MNDIEKQLQPLREKVKEQGDIVRSMRANGAPETDILKEVHELKARKKVLEDMELKLNPPTETIDRKKMSDLIKRRFYYDISFSIYGGSKGFYDYGPCGCEILDNILTEWKRHFVLREKMLKVNCSMLTPEPVLKASGHVEKFADYMVKDVVKGDCYRLDHLIEQWFEKLLADKNVTDEKKATIKQQLSVLEGMTMEEMNNLVKQYDMKAPATGNDLSDACEFNLMFPVFIGPGGLTKGYLRPETAQGIFVNFKNLLECRSELPFACAQIGYAFRNEISPRSGLIRVREFLMGEIEHFCYPDQKNYPKFNQIADVELSLYSGDDQMAGNPARKVRIGDAVSTGMVANETLGYYMARIHQFLIKIGISDKKLRFRQHLRNEMAHYACDCWDAECLTSYGWIECVGCADRSAYDLQQHTKASGVKLTVERSLPQPVQKEVVSPVINNAVLGKTFKQKKKDVEEAILKLDSDQLINMDKALQENGVFNLNGFEITRSMVTQVKKEQKTVHVEELTPSVIEPSFGVGRIFYCLLEHTFKVREDDAKRTYFALPPFIAPVKVSVLPLSKKSDFEPFVRKIDNALTELCVSCTVDDSGGSIGRRYARTDELAIPFGITVDFDTVKNTPHTVTLRERDSTEQVRIPIDDVITTVEKLATEKIKWSEVTSKWPKFVGQETTK